MFNCAEHIKYEVMDITSSGIDYQCFLVADPHNDEDRGLIVEINGYAFAYALVGNDAVLIIGNIVNDDRFIEALELANSEIKERARGLLVLEEIKSIMIRRKEREERLISAPASMITTKSTIPGYVYFLRMIDGDYYKIGRTINPKSRSQTFGITLPFHVQYELLIHVDDYVSLEHELHERFNEQRVDGEWFALTPIDIAIIRAEFADYLIEDRYSD